MAKRFTDTDKWKKPFFRGLDAPYKALWLYILDDCDIAGVWIVDFEIAKIRVGEVNEKTALEKFANHVEAFDAGRKWFIRDFTDFQYGELKETNRMHLAVISILQKNKVGAYKGLTSPQGQRQGQSNGEGQGSIQGQGEKNREWFNSCIDEMFKETLAMTHKGKNIDQAMAEAWGHLSADGPRLRAATSSEVKQLVNTWLTKMKEGAKGNRVKLL